MNEPAIPMYPDCAWCTEPCDNPEKTRFCTRYECNHDGGEAVYCSKSCRVAAHG